MGNTERSWSAADVLRLREMLASYLEPRDADALSRWIEEEFDPPQSRGAQDTEKIERAARAVVKAWLAGPRLGEGDLGFTLHLLKDALGGDLR